MPSIGKDLAEIRNHLGLTIQEVQDATKIPLNTLQSIENGAIFRQQFEIKTYVRSFVRSYGRALKIPDEDLVKALDQQENQTYDHLLLQHFPELRESLSVPEETSPEPPLEEDLAEDPPQNHDASEKEKNNDFTPFPAGPDEDEYDASGSESLHEEEIHSGATDDDNEIKPASSESKESVKKERPNSFKPVPSPGVRNVNWADMGKRFSEEKRRNPVWIISIIVGLIILVLLAYFFYENNFFSSTDEPSEDQTEQIQSNPLERAPVGADLSLDISEEEPEEPAEEQVPVPVLADTLYLTVFAAFDKLNPVRVWGDLKPTVDPYWLEPGMALNFEFRDTIHVRGPYDDMLLFQNGHHIENARQEHFSEDEDAIKLTRALFESDPKWSTPVSLELPEGAGAPNSIEFRPTF